MGTPSSKHDFAHLVAMFMQAQFEHKLALVTDLPTLPPKPAIPTNLSDDLLQGCLLAVDKCVAAYTNPRKCSDTSHP